MPRTKRGTTRIKKRKAVLRHAKGFHWGRKNLIKLAKTAVKKAGVQAYTGRKLKKRVNRGLWQIKISAAVRPLGLNYSKFIGLLKKNKIELDRKVLAELAEFYPEVFKKVVDEVKKK